MSRGNNRFVGTGGSPTRGPAVIGGGGGSWHAHPVAYRLMVDTQHEAHVEATTMASKWFGVEQSCVRTVVLDVVTSIDRIHTISGSGWSGLTYMVEIEAMVQHTKVVAFGAADKCANCDEELLGPDRP